MDHFDKTITHNGSYMIGYAVVTKRKCEIHNFVSNTFRLLHFIDGSVEWKVGNQLHTFHAGDFVIFNNLEKRNIHQVLTGAITYEFLDFLPSCLANPTLRGMFYSNTIKVISAADSDNARLLCLLDGIKAEFGQRQDEMQMLSVCRHLELLALAFYRHIDTESMAVNGALYNIAEIIRYIRDHISEDLSIGRLSQICAYNPMHFSRTFKKYLGVSPMSYIINARIENAIHLVTDRDMTILDAAYQSGFRSSSGFYKAFHAYKMTSPTEYLKKQAKP